VLVVINANILHEIDNLSEDRFIKIRDENKKDKWANKFDKIKYYKLL
jgi:hypothetical protein